MKPLTKTHLFMELSIFHGKEAQELKGLMGNFALNFEAKILGVSYTTPGDTWGFRMIPKSLSACQEAFLATASYLKILLASVLKTR